jgi:hypothetical protein
MDALVSLFPILASTDLSALFLSITLAAVVFFYFIHLLRKEEGSAKADADESTLNIRPAVRREA